ncbi:MAG TPA: alpha-amylase family glycosyl hydrolase [Roseiflexaceae bacterium]|nr:alpha-amylase family glycosyl hydrolase [Roseiflexaceae bacterium]
MSSEQSSPPDNVSADFVFGTLATDDLRLAQIRAASSGVAHAHRLEPHDPLPGQPVTVYVSLGPEVRADRVTCYYTADGSDPDGHHGVAANGAAAELGRAGVEWDTLLWAYRELWAGAIPGHGEGTLVRYRVEAWSSHTGESRWASEIAGVVAGERPPQTEEGDTRLFAVGGPPLWPIRRSSGYAYHVDRERVPDWLHEAVIYHIFLDRFAPGGGRPFAQPATPGGFYGGTLRGVLEQIDYIAALGATCLWLSPLFPSPSHHGYDATDYRSVEPRLGSEEDLRALVEAAHARGIRVILDFVVNHTSWDHPAFRTAIADRASAEADWFTFTNWPDQYLTFFGVKDHPQINSDSPTARAYMIESARHWLALGVDGFRLDYANGPSHGFWAAFRAATRAVAPESATLGEVVETPALQRSYQGRMDGCLDFVLLQALRQFFAFGTLSASAFDMFLRRHLAFFPPDFVLPSFLDNHDMNRFLWVVRGDKRRLRLAALCQFSLPHPPIVYYGTEVGLSQVRDVRYADGSGHPEESRLPMLWGNDQDATLLAFYRDLAALRRAGGAAWREGRATLALDDAAGLYVYSCGADGRALIALNNGSNAQAVALPPASGYRLALATEAGVALDGATLELPPYSGAALMIG